MNQTPEWYQRHQVDQSNAKWVTAQETLPTHYIVKGDFVCFDVTKVSPVDSKYYLVADGRIVSATEALASNAEVFGECFYREGVGLE